MKKTNTFKINLLFISASPENSLLFLHWIHLAAASPHQDAPEHPDTCSGELSAVLLRVAWAA